MAPPSLSVEKRLEAKRAVRRMAKVVRSSIRSSLRNGGGQELWQNLEKQHTDDVSKIALRQLLLMRLELKDMVRNVRLDDLPVEYLMACTGLGKECVEAILRNHGFDPSMSGTPVSASINDRGSERPPPRANENHRKAVNFTFDMPKLDMSGVRNDRNSPERPDSPNGPFDFLETRCHSEVRSASPQQAEVSLVPNEDFSLKLLTRKGFDLPWNFKIADATLLTGMSPREVTDSSAEISDLAKRLGVRLCQDTSLIDHFRKVTREHPFVEQLQEIVASSATLSTVQLKFIPSVPIAKPTPPMTTSKEIDVQTSISISELPVVAKVRDNATDLPSLDYLSMSELGGLRQIPEAFITQDDVSSSAFSSDQSAGQVPKNLAHKGYATISFAEDGSAQVTPSKTIKVSEIVEDSVFCSVTAAESSFRKPTSGTPARGIPRTPRVSESTWRPSSRRLHLEEVDISTSQEASSLEIVSVGTPEKAYEKELRSAATPGRDGITVVEKEVDHEQRDGAEDGLKGSLELSDHDDEEHTYNQVSQIASE